LSETVDTADLGELQGLGSRATSFYERSLAQRTFAPLSAGGIRSSVFVLVQTALGGGVLTIAYMLKISGPFMGVFLLLAGMLVAFVSMDVLMKSAVLLHRYTFGSLVSYAFGPRSGIFLDMMLFLYGNGSLLMYFIFLGDFIPSIFLYFTGQTGTPVADRTTPEYAELRAHCLVAMFLLVFPVSLFRDLSAFKVLSPYFLLAILYTEILVLVTCVSSFRTPDGWDWWQHLREVNIHGPSLEANFSDFPGICRAFSISVMAYCCHLNVVPVAKELTNPQDRRIEKICLRVAYAQLIIYLFMSVAGFLAFGDGTPQNLLEAYSPENRYALVGRCLMAFTVLVALATNTNPTVRAGLCLLEVQVESIRDHDYGISPADLQKSPLQPRPTNGEADKEPSRRRMVRYLLTLVCLFADMVIAMNVRDVANVVGLLGATMGNVMMMVIPLLLLYLLRNDLYDRKWKTIGIAVILFLAGILAVASIFVPKS